MIDTIIDAIINHYEPLLTHDFHQTYSTPTFEWLNPTIFSEISAGSPAVGVRTHGGVSRQGAKRVFQNAWPWQMWQGVNFWDTIYEIKLE